MKHPFHLFAAALRKDGFRRESSTRATQGCPAVTFYEKEVSGTRKTPRTLLLQLWGDGGHRISHRENGREITTPTDFRTVEQMMTAIAFEGARPHEKSPLNGRGSAT